jgi:hypothetical protein
MRFGSTDVLLAFGHVFGSKLDNHGSGAVHALAGNPPTYRTSNTINDGSVQQSITVVSLGCAYRF